MKIVEISVTAEDIANGQRDACTKCPIALAVHRAKLPSGYTLVGSSYISHEDGGYPFIQLPLAAIEFIAAFDSGQSVKPFTFTVEIP